MFFCLHEGLNCLHNRPIEPEEIITAMPIHIPSPPIIIRIEPVKSIAIMVGIGPKNKPDMESIMERVSKTIPGINIHGVNIKTIPIAPKIKPEMILAHKLIDVSFLSQKFSYNIAKVSSIAVLSAKPIIIDSPILKNFLLIKYMLNSSLKCNFFIGNKKIALYVFLWCIFECIIVNLLISNYS